MSILLMLRRAEGIRDLDVSLIQGDLLPFKVWFLIQHPARKTAERERRLTSGIFTVGSQQCLLILLTVQINLKIFCLCFGHKNVKAKSNERPTLVRLSMNPS